MLGLILRNPKICHSRSECFSWFWHQRNAQAFISGLNTRTEPANRDVCEGKESGRRNDVWLCLCFPWMFQSFEMLTGVPITSPSRVTPLRPPTIGAPVGHARTSYYTLHTIQNTLLSFFVKLLFPFYFFLCYLCETCSVVDLFLSESSKTTGFKFAMLNLSFMQIKFSVQTIIWNETSYNI